MAIARLSMRVGKAGKAGPHAAYIAREGEYAHRREKGEALEACEAGNMPLWAQANPLEVTLIVGKSGISQTLLDEAVILLDSHELVKGRVLETAGLTAREASDMLCEALGAEGIQMGTRFVASFESPVHAHYKDAIVSALAYPALLLVMLGFMLWLVSSQMVPAMEAMAPVESWPPVTRGLYHVSNFVRDWGLVTVGIIVAISA